MSKNILILGDIIIDNSYYGYANRLAPEGSFPVVNVYKTDKSLGTMGNVINNIIDFFDNIFTVICLNSDGIDKIKELLPNKVISKMFIQENRNIIIKNRIFCNNKIISRFDEEHIIPIETSIENKINKYISQMIHKIDIVIISDYAKGFLTDNILKKTIQLCKENNIFIAVDPKGKDYIKYKNVSLIKPNKKEAELFFGNTIDISENYDKYSEKIINNLNIKYLLTTLGNEGMCLSYKDHNNKIIHIKKNIIASSVTDVTGCGDSIISAIVIYLNMYEPIDKNIDNFLNILTNVGKKAVSSKGCYQLNLYDWNNFIDINSSYLTKVVIDKEMYLKIKPLLIGKKITFTNGCFDIVHTGHLKFLNECKKYGDILILGINSDNSIKKLKGQNRPINSLQQRIDFLQELSIIDYIIPFSEETPLELIKMINPYYLIKGGDYKLENIIGKEYAKKKLTIKFHEGYSTTNIVNQILNTIN